MPPCQEQSPTAPRIWRVRLRRLAPLVAVMVLLFVVYSMGWHRELSLETLVRHRATIDAFIAAHRLTAVLAFIALYSVAAMLAMPTGIVLAVTGGFLFGTLVGGISAMIGSTIGATAIFLIARTAAGEHLARRAGPAAERLAAGFRADAFSYIVFLRLVPVPSWFTNLTAAVLGVRPAIFVAATALGRSPGSLILAFFGAGLDSLIAADVASYRACLAVGGDDCRIDFDPANVFTPTLLAALVALGLLALLPVVAKRLWLWRRARAEPESS
ncbi:MAG: hypothetical protein QOI12_1406 [Alphaproteobacteria bacterium]|jgi:uncharacterized membrane protein YdjX (TVP38/TMEM64 family)|nr:hypothetical protein [Alphaproteobacteria bacterium]